MLRQTSKLSISKGHIRCDVTGTPTYVLHQNVRIERDCSLCFPIYIVVLQVITIHQNRCCTDMKPSTYESNLVCPGKLGSKPSLSSGKAAISKNHLRISKQQPQLRITHGNKPTFDTHGTTWTQTSLPTPANTHRIISLIAHIMNLRVRHTKVDKHDVKSVNSVSKNIWPINMLQYTSMLNNSTWLVRAGHSRSPNIVNSQEAGPSHL